MLYTFYQYNLFVLYSFPPAVNQHWYDESQGILLICNDVAEA